MTACPAAALSMIDVLMPSERNLVPVMGMGGEVTDIRAMLSPLICAGFLGSRLNVVTSLPLFFRNRVVTVTL